MGLYINPTNESKIQFLRRVGTRIAPSHDVSEEEFNAELAKGNVPCVHIDCMSHVAAGVAYDYHEYTLLADRKDGRPKLWWFVPIDSLQEVCDPDELAMHL